MGTDRSRATTLVKRKSSEVSGAPFPARLLRGDLDSIVAKAARKEPQHRYATVDALEGDIELALKGEPVVRYSVPL